MNYLIIWFIIGLIVINKDLSMDGDNLFKMLKDAFHSNENGVLLLIIIFIFTWSMIWPFTFFKMLRKNLI